ncbi:xanthine dehydrogenase family protein molybdopterin-binding subunit [Proteiniborus sp. MB09-C3]|uniref:xanthine dehydrogenase family protein molybdopterin-binding subunit n=1 Tax=Proteiniborus sp. MB09-C3 TaxID=3050072 RepID=UPI0025573ADC|nr:xanthine dehydrogenase family protein molybdopterin-binding subunit [Proteiniborus sp. MB09-C3]WIV11689.1 xanthine dehydrogenase family protein molybdopterin-binding subunit [Proteiniborus sp. MB09-C3]
MDKYSVIGKNHLRIEGRDKITGRLKYVNDLNPSGLLHAVLKTSPHAHAKIISIDTEEARKASGVRAVVTGEELPYVVGLYLGDKYPLARGKVRHYGEAIAAVIADSEAEAKEAVDLIKITYEQLPPVLSVEDALKEDSLLVHEELGRYQHISAIHPEPKTNVANRTKIRKGNIVKGFEESEVVIEDEFSFPTGDHVAMETRASIAEIKSDGQIIITTTSQAPFVVRSLMSEFFNIPTGKITIISPPIGGGFGGKAGIQLEALAYLLSKAVDGRPVKLVNTREQDLTGSPGRIGFKGKVKMGCTKKGEIKSLELLYMFDAGAYSDYSVNISRAAAIACTGPYRVPNVSCDSLCVYTNHPFTNAFRGFGHMELAFAIEIALDIMAEKLSMDPADIRRLNAIKEGDTSPTGSLMDENTGDLVECIDRVKEFLNWDEGTYIKIDENKVRAKSLTCLWKAPAMPTNTDAGAIITFNEDASINLHCSIVEIGQGTKTGLAQILAEKFKIGLDKIHLVLDVNTKVSPHDWATAASRGLFMAGRAVIEAADDAIRQIKDTASQVLRCPPEDLEVAGDRVFIKNEKHIGLPLKYVVLGYVYENGNAIKGQIIGSGRYISRRLTGIDKDTGEGHPALEWTLGAEGVEVELDLRDYSYKILKSACVMDVGKIINPKIARGQIIGGMAMGLSFAANEAFIFNSRGQVTNDDLRSFKIMRYGEEPEYYVDYVETPQGDGPYGARGIGEQSIIGIPSALANALSRALGVQLKALPLTPENLWKAKKEVE